MRKFGAVVLLAFFLSGCGHDVTGPLPPLVVAQTFEQQIENLNTPAKVSIWMEANATYDRAYNLKWGAHYDDQAYALAYSLYYSDGHGVCGQLAAFYIVAAREHGYICGAIVYYTGNYGHALGWIVEPEGTVSITDNKEYFRNRYSSYQEFYTTWKKNLNASKQTYGMLLNNKFQVKEVML